MKEQLIALAKEKGFEARLSSHNHTNLPYNKKIFNKEAINLSYYLWICELQKWLRDVQKIDIIIDVSTFGETYSSFIPNFIRGDWRSGECNSYEQALEAGLIEGLKLINN